MMMTSWTNKIEPSLDVGALIQELLGIEPSAIALRSAEPGGKSEGALLGLGALMRRVLELAITLSGRHDLVVRLKTERAASSHGWPDASVANFAMLLVWGLVQRRRRGNGLSTATLDAPAEGAADRPVKIERRIAKMSIDELLAEYEKPTAQQGDVWEQGKTFPITVAGKVGSMLGLDPATLHLYRSDDTCQGLNQEILARFGVEALIQDVMAQFRTMRERGTTTVRLMSEDCAADAMIPCARAGQIATLLATALLSQTKTALNLLAPKARTATEKSLLRETAKLVYLAYSDEAMRGFELVCDGVVHFGHGSARTIAEKLLREVARECDPGLEAVPYSVRLQIELEELAEFGRR